MASQVTRRQMEAWLLKHGFHALKGGMTGHVQYEGPGGVKVTLSASPGGILSVPVTATIPAGQTAAYMVVPASMVDSQVAVTVKASYDGRSIMTPTVVRNMST